MKRILVAAAACALGVAQAEEKSVYQVTSGGEAGIDLTALGDTYYKDRLAGPGSKSVVCVTGAVTHAAASGAAFGLVGRGGRLNLWQTGLIDADRHLVHPLAISGAGGTNADGTTAPAFDIWDGKLTLGADWASQLRFAADNRAGLQFPELTVTDTSGTPFTFNPNGPVYVSRQGTAGVARLGQDGGRLTADFTFPFGCWVGDTASKHDNRYTSVYIGGASTSGGVPGYANLTYRTAGHHIGYLRFGYNVTAATSLQAAQGLTNVVTFTGNGNCSCPNMYRNGPESCLVRFAGENPGLWQPGHHGELFGKLSDDADAGRFVLESVDGAPIYIRLSKGSMGTSSVVEFRGAGDVTVSFGDSSAAPNATKSYTPATLRNPSGTKVVWNNSGEFIVTQHAVVEGENAFPYGPGRGGVKITSNWCTVNGTSQRFNSLYGGGTVCNLYDNDVVFTVGEHGGACEYDVVAAPATSTAVGKYNGGTVTNQANCGWTVDKVGAGTLTVKKAPPGLLRVSAGAAQIATAVTVPELELAAGARCVVSGGTLTVPRTTFAAGTFLDLCSGGTLVVDVAAGDVLTNDFAHIHGDTSTIIRKTGAGRLVLAGDASAFAGCFDVQGGTLAFADETVIGHTVPVLTVGTDATLEIAAGKTVRAYSVTVRGTQGVTDATYSSVAGAGVEALAGLAGGGFLNVASGSGVWTGAVSDDPAAAGNWKNATAAPDLASPGFSATFAEGDDGGAMDIARTIAFRGVTFNASVSDFAFNRTDPAGELVVAAGGLSAPDDRAASAPMRLDVTAPVTVGATALWNWGTNTTLALHAPLAGVGTLYKAGGGAFELYTTNSTYTGDIVVSNGNLHVYGKDALGPSGKLRLLVKLGKTNTKGQGVNLYLHNATISKDIERADGGGYDNRRGIHCAENTTNVIYGALNDGTCPQLQVPSSSTLVLAGGYSCTYMNWGANGTVVITNKPLNVGTGECTAQNLVLCCTGNTVSRFGGTGGRPNRSCANVGLDIRVDEPLTFTAAEKEICTSGYIKLNGHDWTIPTLRMDSGSYVSSDAPGTLTVEQDYPYPAAGVFKEAVNLVKRGTATLRLTAANTSTGSVTVTEGTLSFTNNASWKAACEVRVSGTGTLEAWNASVFGDAARRCPLADLHLSDDGVYAFPEGVTGVQRVGRLFLDGAERPAPMGVYGALDNTSVPVAFRTRHITGAGLIQSVGDGRGLALVFR